MAVQHDSWNEVDDALRDLRTAIEMLDHAAEVFAKAVAREALPAGLDQATVRKFGPKVLRWQAGKLNEAFAKLTAALAGAHR